MRREAAGIVEFAWGQASSAVPSSHAAGVTPGLNSLLSPTRRSRSNGPVAVP